MLQLLNHILLSYVCIVTISLFLRKGASGVLNAVIKRIRDFPGVDTIIDVLLATKVRDFVRQIDRTDESQVASRPVAVRIPEKGIPHEQLLVEMHNLKGREVKLEDGRVFAYVYTSEGEHYDCIQRAYELFSEGTAAGECHDGLVGEFSRAFMHENALNPMIFPALRKFENETVAMTASMLHGDHNVVGLLTSGGSESILLAVKTYRDRARTLFPHITNPEIVAPITVHPAFVKAAKYFDVKIVHTPLDDNFCPNLGLYKAAITPNTILLVASAPQYCHGIVDPIDKIGKIANEFGLPLHVDACFGGFMLPWVEKLGYEVPIFDFRVAAVTSMSADIHKYGFGLKGSSVLLYRSNDIRKYQYFAYSEWPGGLFASPGLAGTRPGANIASSWAALRSMGVDGYMRNAQQLMNTTNKMKSTIEDIKGLCIIGQPHMTSFAIRSNDPDVDILAVAEVMESQGWKMERQQLPNCLHCSVLPHHIPHTDKFLAALTQAADTGNREFSTKGLAGVYGMVAKMPDKTLINDFLIQFFSEVYTTK
ncbi:uncharacterized protein LOC134195300 isoform X2 [Corticium candelabrum]|uniref:uncharacterized protein LOC134195300 isoform X2 n=1 Tax=Corticium candelabrum TaxID=121492 RepID=UPI002E2611E5|nr:uncharacterized protein LOC134195300 isoform X2 [Corticium candelabrum]